MLSLFLILIVTAMTLTVVLWAGTYFFQGYIYTEPSPAIFWQAPAAAAVLTFGYLIWCLSIAFSSKASPSNLPIDTLFRFNPTEDMLDRPAASLWAIKRNRKKGAEGKDGEVTRYKSKRDTPTKFHYEDTSVKPNPWRGQDVIAIEIELDDKSKMRFDKKTEGEGEYPYFASSDGWVMRVYEEGPTGLPTKFRFTRLLLNLFFNSCHFAGWFLCLWLLLRFQWSHALGLAVVMWLIFTLTLLPMMLGFAGEVAAAKQAVKTISLIFLASPLAA